MRSNLRSFRAIIFGAINFSRSSSQRLSFCLKEELPYKSLEILVIYCFNEKSIIQFFSNRLLFSSLFLYDFRSQYYQQAPQQFSPRSASIISQRSLNSREWGPLFFLRKYSNHLRSRQKRKRRTRAMTVNIAKQIPKSMLVGLKLVKSQQSEKKLLDQKFCTYSEKVSQIFCIVLWDCIQQIQVMEINKPDKGLFRGMGPLQVEKHINKKYFPRIRNIHQFEYTHYHPNDNVSTFQRFFSANKSTPICQKVNKNTNQSSLQLGNDSKNYFTSLAKTDYKQFQRVKPPTLIRQKQQGITLGEQIPPAKHYMTTMMQQFGQSNIKEKAKVTFRDRGAQRFNPITGQTRTLNFGFEDFSMNRDNAYRANNFSYIPQKGERVDIISGRRLTYK